MFLRLLPSEKKYMFANNSYLFYTFIFTIPPLLFLWMRREFFEILKKKLRGIILSTGLLTIYGSVIWPIALNWGAWAYGEDKIINIRLFNYVFIEDVMWWVLISLLFSSFVFLSTEYENRGIDIVLHEMKKLIKK